MPRQGYLYSFRWFRRTKNLLVLAVVLVLGSFMYFSLHDGDLTTWKLTSDTGKPFIRLTDAALKMLDRLTNTYAFQQTGSQASDLLKYDENLGLQAHTSSGSSKVHASNQELFQRIKVHLDLWLSRPILSAQESFRQNAQSCPIELEQQSAPDQLENFLKSWNKLSSDSIHQIRLELVEGVYRYFDNPSLAAALRSAPDGSSTPADAENSHQNNLLQTNLTIKRSPNESPLGNNERGIVITAGNKDTNLRMMAILRILRNQHHSKLPVQIFGFPDEIELLSQHQAEMDSLQHITIHELPYEKVSGAWKNFHIKGAAIIHSSFTEILYLDSDNIPLTEPSYLFELEDFKHFGIALWPDISKDGPRNPIWRISGIDCIPQDWQIDSGQILLNKKAQDGLIFGALLIACLMQFQHKFWFTISNGDKDTFRYALYILRLPWKRAPHWLSSGGTYDSNQKFCGHTMFQYSLSQDDWLTAYPQLFTSSISPELKLEVFSTEKETQENTSSPPNPQHAISRHAPPLFAHVNLLKYSGNRFLRGQTFRTLKRIEPSDHVSSDNLELMNMIRTNVDSSVGLCVDYSVKENFDAPNHEEERKKEAVTGVSNPNDSSLFSFENKTSPKVRVIEEDWKLAWSGVLKQFEQSYWDNGGL